MEYTLRCKPYSYGQLIGCPELSSCMPSLLRSCDFLTLPASPNGIPYIGRVPSLANMWVNAGQFRNGLVLAPASARLLADLLLQRQPCVDATPYQLA